MKLLILPAAIALAMLVYLPLPAAASLLTDGLRALYTRSIPLMQKTGVKRPDAAALAACCAVLLLAAALVSLVHPLACAVLAAPLFTAWAALPACAKTKATLDSGAYANDIPAYEALVRQTCASLVSPFVCGMIAPVLLCALGIALRLGCAPGWLFLFLLSVRPRRRLPRIILLVMRRASSAVMRFMLRLCSCAAGKNPLRAQGATPRLLLMNILGIAGDQTDTHAPMAGDLSQAAFLCVLCTAVLLIMLTALLAPFV